jgi:hypothetical protein
MARKLFMLVILLLISAPVSAQSMATAWVSRYNGPADANDKPCAMAIDGSGNVYVTGYSSGGETWWDYLTIKYLPDGDTAWVRRYDGPASTDDAARAIAVDGSGNVFVTGWSNGVGTVSDCATIKYDPYGNELWVRRYNGSADGEDIGWAIVVDGGGNVYVTGQSFDEGTGRDYLTIKYTSDGDTVWLRRYGGPTNEYDYAAAVALDDYGCVYVTGQSYTNETGWDCVTIKYLPNGDTVWVRRFDNQGSEWDVGKVVAVDSESNVYVTGETSTDSTFKDYLTIKYHPDGDTAWARTYNGPADGLDKTYDLAVDARGWVYVTGNLLMEAG